MKAEPETHEDGEEFCQRCWAREVALELIEAAIFNALAAGNHPSEIHDKVVEVLNECCGDYDDDDADEMTAATPTAGRA